MFSIYSVALPQESMPKAKAAALRAIELDDSLAEAHSTLGVYLSMYSWNQAAAENEFRRHPPLALTVKQTVRVWRPGHFFATRYRYLLLSTRTGKGTHVDFILTGLIRSVCDPLTCEDPAGL
jgi:hypothetical protein